MTIFMVTHKCSYFLQQIRNVFYYETTVGDPATGEWEDIVDEIRDDYDNGIENKCSANWIFTGIDYRVVGEAGLPALSVTPTLGDLAGSGVTDGLATQLAIVINVKGDTVKPRIGRTFMGGFDEGQMADSLWHANVRSAAETFIDLQSGLNAAGTNPLQRVAAQWNTNHTLVIASNNIAGFAAVATTVPATVRSRRIGVGI